MGTLIVLARPRQKKGLGPRNDVTTCKALILVSGVFVRVVWAVNLTAGLFSGVLES